jgi:site-specific recombinase XerD
MEVGGMKRATVVNIKSVPPQTWENALQRFVALRRAEQAAPYTIAGYVENVKLFFERYPTAWSDTCRDCLLEHLAQEGIAPPTYNIRLKTLKHFFDFCVREGAFASNPANGLKLRHADPRMVDHSQEDLKAMITVMDTTTFVGLRDKALFLLSLDCGIRPSEALQLRVNDIDLDLNRAVIRSSTAKTRRSRVVFFSNQTANVLRQLITSRPEEWDLSIPLFCTSYGEHWNTRAWTHQLGRYAKKAGLKRFSAYDLRHQHAIEYLRNGGNLATLQKEMGHTTISMTQKYLALSEDDIQTAHAKASPVSNLLPRRKRLTRLQAP